ncbi:MAG: MotA/TolQ/ExbB proton channel family protein [Pseudomonadota bacterium]
MDLGLSLTGAGGPILAVLAVLSIVSIALILLRLVALWPVLRRRASRAEALARLRAGDADRARDAIAPPRVPADHLLMSAIERVASGRAAGLEADLIVAGNAASAQFFKGIRALETIAMVSPLLGLLGTVLGMIQAFRDLELAEGAANAALLAGGIWQALLTTAAGLIVALPAAAAAAMLSARAEAATAEVEAIIGSLLALGSDQGSGS